jgi:murein DD-endopeptidase MepM/ murein hydrolase activator NlpD
LIGLPSSFFEFNSRINAFLLKASLGGAKLSSFKVSGYFLHSFSQIANHSRINFNSPSEFLNPNKDGNSQGFTTFNVVYGKENQNHFTNIQLDQAEFSETAESLQVIDKLSQQGGSDKTSKGQNLNAMYLTRSYTCQVESLGNMMIQPMTYFDLIGVPMFSGAYLITEVRHSFTANHAKTTFKGVRQPRMTTPIVTDAAVAMNIDIKTAEGAVGTSISNIGGSSAGSTSSSGALVAAKFLPEISNDIKKLFGNPMSCTYKPNVGSNFLRNNNAFHGGIDISPTIGMELYTDGQYKDKKKSVPVISAYNGTVVRVGESDGFGTPPNGGVVVVRYGEDNGNKPFLDGFYYFFVYGHVDPDPSIKLNTVVKTGQVLGKAVWPNIYKGSSVTNTGLHLHFQVHRQPSDKTSWVSGQEYMIVPTVFLNQKESCITGIVDYTSGQAGDSVTSGTNSGKCTPTKPLPNPIDYKPTVFKDVKTGAIGGVKWNSIDSNSQKHLWKEYAPLFENNKTISSLPKGMKILMAGQAIQEGYFPGARAYTTKNPGNIGNTDKKSASGGKNTNLGTLENGTLAQAKFIYSSVGKLTVKDGVPSDVVNANGSSYAFYKNIGKPVTIPNALAGDKTQTCVSGLEIKKLQFKTLKNKISLF